VKTNTYQFLVCFFSLSLNVPRAGRASHAVYRLRFTAQAAASLVSRRCSGEGGLNAFTHEKYLVYVKQKTKPPQRTDVQNRVQRLQKSGGGDEGRDTVRVHVRRRPPVLVVPTLLRVRGAGDADAAEA
jgi:predicted polyphosphate/ATP-dependent NAD kinase